jgi:hypothetical protein
MLHAGKDVPRRCRKLIQLDEIKLTEAKQMFNSIRFKLILVLGLALMATDASAGRRGVRVDSDTSWTQFAIGSAGCPGTTAGATAANTLVQRLGFTFSGRANTAYLVNDYCQVALAGTLTTANYFQPDERDLARLFGDNPNAIAGIRYSILDNADLFSATGFQWGFYTFPTGVTVVGLYGLQTLTLDNTSSISSSVWNGQNGYSGQYFCFQNGAYIGSWNALTDTNNACLHALGVVFVNGFE